ncbi:MAG: tRNA (adenosine(37)-N6)-threonylcarbamoyltransferase complex ATPase subunit type 1 TsaE [Gemmatimonadaceae bacterium]
MTTSPDFPAVPSSQHANASVELTLPELEVWGESLAKSLSRPCVVTLAGDLGAGKTTLARALCRGFGVTDANAVTSPTFAILQEYAAPEFRVTHVDLYRLGNEQELDNLGWDEIVDSAQALIVEWPERTARGWPAGTVHVQLGYGVDGLNSRTVKVLR